MPDYESEIRYLRMSLKRLHIFVVVLLCGVVGLVLSITRQVSVHADSVPDILTTKKLVIVDGAGNQRVVVGEAPLEFSSFDILDPNTNVFGVSVFFAADNQSSRSSGPSDSTCAPSVVLRHWCFPRRERCIPLHRHPARYFSRSVSAERSYRLVQTLQIRTPTDWRVWSCSKMGRRFLTTRL